MGQIINFLKLHWDKILLAGKSIATTASIIVELTTTKKDNVILMKILKVISFARDIISRKKI